MPFILLAIFWESVEILWAIVFEHEDSIFQLLGSMKLLCVSTSSIRKKKTSE